jgi:hypothetical protein
MPCSVGSFGAPATSQKRCPRSSPGPETQSSGGCGRKDTLRISRVFSNGYLQLVPAVALLRAGLLAPIAPAAEMIPLAWEQLPFLAAAFAAPGADIFARAEQLAFFAASVHLP